MIFSAKWPVDFRCGHSLSEERSWSENQQGSNHPKAWQHTFSSLSKCLLPSFLYFGRPLRRVLTQLPLVFYKPVRTSLNLGLPQSFFLSTCPNLDHLRTTSIVYTFYLSKVPFRFRHPPKAERQEHKSTDMLKSIYNNVVIAN